VNSGQLSEETKLVATAEVISDLVNLCNWQPI